MPRGQPFTRLCQLAARKPHAGRADLHIHTTASDGTYTPAQVVDLARLVGLSAVAITDHDTTAALPAARAAARGPSVEVIAGAEITAEYEGREVHLLAYYIDPENRDLAEALARLRQQRQQRFVETLRRLGLPQEVGSIGAPDAWGRRHLAELLVRAGKVATVRDAFRHYLRDGSPLVAPKLRLPAGQALELIRGAGGVAALAHPAYDATVADLAAFRSLGLGGVEVEYPAVQPARRRQLRDWADALGLAVTGGSDCHGPGRRGIGAHTISAEELDRLRQMA
jgi:predicted metal-dependent phosphoesterase TrpH